MKFENLIILEDNRKSAAAITETLNRYGLDRWEVSGVTGAQTWTTFYLKRELMTEYVPPSKSV